MVQADITNADHVAWSAPWIESEPHSTFQAPPPSPVDEAALGCLRRPLGWRHGRKR